MYKLYRCELLWDIHFSYNFSCNASEGFTIVNEAMMQLSVKLSIFSLFYNQTYIGNLSLCASSFDKICLLR